MIRVSIIVPVFNIREELLSKCIDSLINQSLEETEIILVDDASTKIETINLLKKYKDSYKDKIVLITHKVNKKIGGARNTGLNIAKGEFVGFVDADDYVDKDMYKLLYTKAVEDGSDLVICNYTEVTDNGDIIRKKISVKDINNAEEFLIYPGPTWAKLYLKRLLIENNLYFTENLFYEDHPVSGMHFLYATKVSAVDDYLYFYVKHASSVVAKKKLTIDDVMKVGGLYIEDMIRRGFFEKYKDIILARYFRIYFLINYKFVMRYRSNYYDILKYQISELQKYGVDIKHDLIQKQLRKKHKYQLGMLFKYPLLFRLYTDIKYWKKQRLSDFGMKFNIIKNT